MQLHCPLVAVMHKRDLIVETPCTEISAAVPSGQEVRRESPLGFKYSSHSQAQVLPRQARHGPCLQETI